MNITNLERGPCSKKILLVVALTAILMGCGGGGPSLDKAKSLKQGMSETEVTTILGSPSNKQETDLMGKKMVVLMYTDGEPQITVFLQDGKTEAASAGTETLFGKVSKP